MKILLSIDWIRLIHFGLIFVRIFSIIFFFPVLGSRKIPVRIKLAISLVLSIFTYFHIDLKNIPTDSIFLFLLVPKEILLGLTIGLAAKLIFSSLLICGQFVGYQMGFAIVNILDPTGSSEISILAVFENILAIFIFFVFNIHHLVIKILFKSFSSLPIGSFYISNSIFSWMIKLGSSVFDLAARLSAPVVIITFAINVILSIISRTIPQINVFIVGFPLQIGVGLIVFSLSLTFCCHIFKDALFKLFEQIFYFLNLR